MTATIEENDLKDRLNLIETMIAEGRRKTESWGWTFVLWGAAYYIAIAWSAFGHANLAWPVTMIATSIVMAVVISRRASHQPETTMGRAIGSVWTAMGISVFLLLMCLSWGGHYESHTFMAIIGAMLGMANATSSMTLKWKAQFACAVVWWASTVIACFASEKVSSIAFLTALFLCQIVFGVYCMVRESKERKLRGVSHA